MYRLLLLCCVAMLQCANTALSTWRPLQLSVEGQGLAVSLGGGPVLLCRTEAGSLTGSFLVLNATSESLALLANYSTGPAPLSGSGRTVVATGGTVFFLAGVRNGGPITDVQALDLAQLRWSSDTAGFSPRSFGSAFVEGETLFFGFGLDWMGQGLRDLWAYADGSWNRVADIGSRPPPSAFSTCAVLNGSAFFFGGLASSQALNPPEIYRFDVVQQTWTTLEKIGAPPPARWSHVSAAFGTRVLIYAGQTTNAILTDLWSFDLEKRTWSIFAQNRANGPPDTLAANFAFVSANHLYVLGNPSYALSLGTPTATQSLTPSRTATSTETPTQKQHRPVTRWPPASLGPSGGASPVPCHIVAILVPVLVLCAALQLMLYCFCRRRQRRYLLDGEWYLMEEVLGKGNYGQVFKGMNKTTKELVAMKQFVSPTLQREVTFLTTFSHPNIVRYLGTCEAPKWGSLLILELCANGSVAALLQRNGSLAIEHVRHILSDVLQGLAYLHALGVVHRDVKPANILISETNVCKLADFGVSRQTATLPSTASITGTLRYLSPEALNGKVSPAQDIWATALSALEMTENRPPWSHLGLFVSDAYLLGCIIAGRYPIPAVLPRLLIDFLEQCLVRQHDRRWRAVQLIEHPFITDNRALAPTAATLSTEETNLPSTLEEPPTQPEESFRRIEL